MRVQAADGRLNQLVALRTDWAKFVHRLGASDPDDLLAYAATLDHADIMVGQI